MLNDSVNAAYTHTLTVTGRLGGHYQCIVSNDKPSSDSSSITVQGDFCIYIVPACVCCIVLISLLLLL